MKTDSRTIVFACAGVAVLAAIMWAPRPHKAVVDGVLDALSVKAPQSEVYKITVREFLAAYWGARWPEVEAQLTPEQETYLDTLIDPATVPSWEAAAPQISAGLEELLMAQHDNWVQQQRDQLLATEFERDGVAQEKGALSIGQRTVVQAILDYYDTLLAPVAAESFEWLLAADQQIRQSQLYDVSLFVGPCVQPAEGKRSHCVVMQRIRLSPWTVSYTIDPAVWPDLASVLNRLAGLRDERARVVADYIEHL